MQRPSQASRPKKGGFICPDADFLRDYPSFAAGLCDLWWDDGKPREPWAIRIQISEASVSLAITDKDNKLVSFTTATSLAECFRCVESALQNGGLSWRKSKW